MKKEKTFKISLQNLIKTIYSSQFIGAGLMLFLFGQIVLTKSLQDEFIILNIDFQAMGGTLAIIIQFVGLLSLFYGQALFIIQLILLTFQEKQYSLETSQRDLEADEVSEISEPLKIVKNTLKFLNTMYLLISTVPLIYIIYLLTSGKFWTNFADIFKIIV